MELETHIVLTSHFCTVSRSDERLRHEHLNVLNVRVFYMYIGGLVMNTMKISKQLYVSPLLKLMGPRVQG